MKTRHIWGFFVANLNKSRVAYVFHDCISLNVFFIYIQTCKHFLNIWVDTTSFLQRGALSCCLFCPCGNVIEANTYKDVARLLCTQHIHIQYITMCDQHNDFSELSFSFRPNKWLNIVDGSRKIFVTGSGVAHGLSSSTKFALPNV